MNNAYKQFWDAWEDEFIDAYRDSGELSPRWRAFIDLDFETTGGENFLRVHKTFLAELEHNAYVNEMFYGDRK